MRVIITDPVEYPWSSYQKNAMGKGIALITPHRIYNSLGTSDEKRQSNYQSLFSQLIPDYALTEIRDAINKTWVLGDEQFKKQIEQQTGKPLLPLKRGGDRKSRTYRNCGKIKFI